MKETRSTGDFKVLVVDDSAVARGMVARAVESTPGASVAHKAVNGRAAVEWARQNHCDAVILDIEMPEMDGLTALPKLLDARPQAKVLMASTLTQHNADVTLRAMRAGAADYVPKPSSMTSGATAETFRKELRAKLEAFADDAKETKKRSTWSKPARPKTVIGTNRAPSGMSLRSGQPKRPDVILVGSSTGGPQALFRVISDLGRGLRQPVLITQHMPATFTRILAEHIARQCKVDCVEGRDGDFLREGAVFVAPGDHHMTVTRKAGRPAIALSKGPPENYCRPSVDPMIRSAVQIYGEKALAVILTGMGHDGLEGCRKLVEARGSVFAQDEATSTVWGMPGAVAKAGLCSKVLPLPEIGGEVRKLATSRSGS